MVSRAVARKDVLDRGVSDLFAESGQLLIRHPVEMQASHIRAYIPPPQQLSNIRQNIGQACMGTAVEDYAAETGHFNILEDYAMDLTDVEQGYNATSELLTKYPDIDVIYSVNDNSAIGAYQAIVAAGKEDDGILIWGYTGMPNALDAIAQGHMYGTSYTDPYYEGYAAMVMALMSIQTGANSVSMGNEFFANIVLPTQIVTQENVLDVIKGTHWDMSAYNY